MRLANRMRDNVTNDHKGTSSASDAKWKAHQQELSQLRDYQTRGSFAYNGGETKRMLSFLATIYTCKVPFV